MAHVIGLALTWIGALGIIGIGLAYLTKNEQNAVGFGLPTPPAPEARGWWQAKEQSCFWSDSRKVRAGNDR